MIIISEGRLLPLNGEHVPLLIVWGVGETLLELKKRTCYATQMALNVQEGCSMIAKLFLSKTIRSVFKMVPNGNM